MRCDAKVVGVAGSMMGRKKRRSRVLMMRMMKRMMGSEMMRIVTLRRKMRSRL